MKKLPIAEFRTHMKAFLEEVLQKPGLVYQIGTDRDVFLLSAESLKLLQLRHVNNLWVKERFDALHLGNYRTLSEGSKTKQLPMFQILGITEVCTLVEKLFTLLAKPGAKTNVKKWDVTPYVKHACEGRPLSNHGRFDSVYVILTRLFGEKLAECFMTNRTWTLYEWLEEMKRQTAQMFTGNEMLESFFDHLFAWVLIVMDAQEVEGVTDIRSDHIYGYYDQLYAWYKTYVLDDE